MHHFGLFLAGLLATAPSAAFATETIAYGYDALGRLVEAARSGTVNSGVTTSYQYDRADNRVMRTTTGSPNSLIASRVIVVPLGGLTIIPIPSVY